MIVTTQMTYESAQLINSVAKEDYTSAWLMVQFANTQLADHDYILYKNEQVKDAQSRVGFCTWDRQGHRLFIDVQAMFREGDRYCPHHVDPSERV